MQEVGIVVMQRDCYGREEWGGVTRRQEAIKAVRKVDYVAAWSSRS